jgi:hypothetical protein
MFCSLRTNNFATVQRKMGNTKYGQTVYDHCVKMANKLLDPDSKFAEILNMSSSSDTVRQNRRNVIASSAEKPKRSRPFTSQSNATSKFKLRYRVFPNLIFGI